MDFISAEESFKNPNPNIQQKFMLESQNTTYGSPVLPGSAGTTRMNLQTAVLPPPTSGRLCGVTHSSPLLKVGAMVWILSPGILVRMTC